MNNGKDLSVVFLTANQHPPAWTAYQQQVLFEAIGDYPLITVTRKPLGLPGKEILDTEPRSHHNMYWQLLQAAKVADTPYIATAEDDVLYSKEHFNFHRPALDTFAYDMSRWSLFTWKPIFSLKQRISNCTLIAPRLALIEALEERFAKFPGTTMPWYFVSEVGRNMYERQMGLVQRKTEKVYAEVPCIHFNHDNGTDSTQRRKKLGQIKALEIPRWGRAEDLVKLYV